MAKKRTKAASPRTLSAQVEKGIPVRAGSEDVTTLVEISSVVALTGATIKSLYEAEPSAYTDAKDTKLSGIETGATADQTSGEIETAYNAQVALASQVEAEAGTLTTVRRWTPERVKQAIDALAPGGGGGITRSVDNPAAIGVTSLQAVRLGGSAVTFGGSAAAGFTLSIPADTEITQIDITATNDTGTNASGEFVIAIDNSANSYDRQVMYELYDGSNDQKVDQHLTGNIMQQAISGGNITTLTIPNVQGGYPNGFRLLLR